MAQEALGIEYEQVEPHALVFTPSDAAPQRVRLVNHTNDVHALFKVQCSAPGKLRIRPALASLPPSTAIDVAIRLSSQVSRSLPWRLALLFVLISNAIMCMCELQESYEHHQVECKLLVEMRLRCDDTERDPPAQWAAAAQAERKPLRSETITVRIMPGPPDENQASVDATMGPAASVVQASPTIEQQTDIVRLLMKNQSDRVENRLSAHETRELERLRVQWIDETQWRAWEVFAARMRVLLREQARRQQA
uniref:MSP domain-containing protein n=1 Tax=Globisporangium ultimum (strain ATCC 200006 / CBS 805.95 / DAOM BR144) TaxID=431595 RepID=K3WXG8_GLOUD